MGLSILVVEDDEHIALAITQMLSRAIVCETVDIAHDGLQAWERLQQRGYDLIVSDWNMPNKSGDELLVDVRSSPALAPTPFLMLTARADRQSVLVAVQGGVTGYITKPFDKQDLLAEVTRLLGAKAVPRSRNHPVTDAAHTENASTSEDILVDIIDHLNALIATQRVELPVLPDVAFSLTQLLQNDYVTAEEVVETVSRDPVIASQLLKVANSAYCRSTTPFTTIDAAIKRLGFKQTQNIVLMSSTQGLFQLGTASHEQRLGQIWNHSQMTALVARQLASTLLPKAQEALFTMGLLHDIGKVVTLTIIQTHYTQLDATAIDSCLEALHTQAGAALLRSWSFDSDVISAVLHHHNAQQVDSFTMPVSITAFSNEWAHHLLDIAPPSATWSELGAKYHLDIEAMDEERFNRQVLEAYKEMGVVG